MNHRRTAHQALVSCLCVTQDRPAFMPWLLWNYDRQTWANRQLVIIDSSKMPLQVDREDVRVIHAPHGSGVAQKRNLALQHARGELVSWFDDDDWQHPEKLACLVQALGSGKPFAGSAEGWFVDLHTMKCARYRSPGGRILFNSGGFRSEVARKVTFPKHLKKASDTHWMNALQRRFGTKGDVLDRPLFFWLCHQNNLSNPNHKRSFNRDFAALKTCIGGNAWGDTEAALQALKNRLESDVMSKDMEPQMAHPYQANPSKQPAATSPVIPSLPDPAQAHTPVTAIVKATVQDAAYLGVMVPHMLRQAHYPFAERLVVIDPRREFAGKYRDRHASSRQALDRVLDELQSKGEIDRVLEVPYDPGSISAVNRAYFGRPDVPTHATSGGPIYPTLWALEQAATDYVLQFDADIFFYSYGDSWVKRAIDCMRRDPRLWLMMTHAGPPAGPPGRSIAGANLRRARWDAALQVWRFRTASTRFFLIDRRKLRGRLPVLGNSQGCRPLEQCISSVLSSHNAFRGDVGNCRSWHLHAHSHAHPFSDWVQHLIEAIEQGRYPTFQSGNYDLSLDKPRDRAQWQAMLFPVKHKRADSSSGIRQTQTLQQKDPLPLPSQTGPAAPIRVIIPVRDRSADRLRATLASLQWQERPPIGTLIVSHGSSPDTDTVLEALCHEQGIAFERIGKTSEPWCKSAALNHGIRQGPSDIPYVMTLDADMILQPNFLSVVITQLEQSASHGAMVLCRSRDLPKTVRIPQNTQALRASFDRLRSMGRLRGRQGCGGIQAAPREFFFSVHGYDEIFTWWGEEDRDMVSRAEEYGLQIRWIESHTSMLHQWHPHATHSSDPHRRHLVSQALEQNRALRIARQGLVVRDTPGW